MSTTHEKPFLRAVTGTALDIPPIWLMRQAGRYLPEYRRTRAQSNGFLDMCFRPDLATEVTLQPIRRYGFDAAILFSDILVVPHAMGREVRFVEGEGPKLDGLKTGAEINALRIDGAEDQLGPVYEAVSHIKAKLPDETALIGFAGAPWTIACYMVDGQGSKDYLATKRFAVADPVAFQALIDAITTVTGAYLCRQIDAGAEAVQIFDSWAGVLPVELFERFCIAPITRIVQTVRGRYPTIPILGFPKDAGPRYGEFAATTRVDTVSLDSSASVPAVIRSLEGRAATQGNLDPAYLLAGGDAMLAAAAGILRATAGHPHVFNLGHGVNLNTDPDEVGRLVQYIRSGAWKQ